jgi:hypothetical protein
MHQSEPCTCKLQALVLKRLKCILVAGMSDAVTSEGHLPCRFETALQADSPVEEGG